MNAGELTNKPGQGFRRLRRMIWASPVYRLVRRTGAALTRPLRRLEIAIIYRQDLRGQVDVFEADIDLDISRASAEEVDRAAATLGRHRPGRRDRFRWRLENGCMCFVARAGSTLVAYDWFRFRPGPEDGDMIALGEGEVFLFDLHVDENWRGHRIQGAIGTRIRFFCKQQGYTTAYTQISAMNRKSLKGGRGWTASGVVLRVRGSKRGRWPIITLWGSSHPLSRLRSA